MSHLIIHGSHGEMNFERFATIDDAVHAVERLRNDGVDEVRLFRLEEIPLEVKAYFKVELIDGDESHSGAAPVVESVPTEERAEASEPMPVSSEPSIPRMTEAPARIEKADLPPEPLATAEDFAAAEEDMAVANGSGARRGLFGR